MDSEKQEVVRGTPFRDNVTPSTDDLRYSNQNDDLTPNRSPRLSRYAASRIARTNNYCNQCHFTKRVWAYEGSIDVHKIFLIRRAYSMVQNSSTYLYY